MTNPAFVADSLLERAVSEALLTAAITEAWAQLHTFGSMFVTLTPNESSATGTEPGEPLITASVLSLESVYPQLKPWRPATPPASGNETS